jgi:polyferredoxin
MGTAASTKIRPTPLTPPKTTYHRVRKNIHWFCVAIFVLLPFTDLLRFDIPSQRVYLFGAELWINEFAILFFSLMFLLFVLVAVSMLYGRMYCSYACPQMIFSEWSLWTENWFQRKINKRRVEWSAQRKKLVARAGFYSVLAIASVFLAFIFTSYFVEPRDLIRRLLSFDIRTAGGITGAVVTLITFVDFTLLRQRFCTTVCPYGYLQGMLGDNDTLLVHYRDDSHACIECKKCVRVCHMGIDIRNGPFQIECIHCGECVDACEDVLRRLGKKTLIHYAWGEKGEVLEDKAPWCRKAGFRDPKRLIVMCVVLLYAFGLYAAISMRRAVLVQVSPIRAELYRIDDAGNVRNKFRVKIANRGKKDATVRIAAENLANSQLLLEPNPIACRRGATVEREFEIAVPRPAAGADDVTHFRLIATADNGEKPTLSDETFITPYERKAP